MKILCVEDGSVDIDALENGELRDGKVLVYRQGSKPPFVLDIPNNNIPRIILELKEILGKINHLKSWCMDGNPKYLAFKEIGDYVWERLERIEKELLTHQHEDKGE